MNILLFGRDDSITHTIHDMINSAPGWMATLIYNLESKPDIEVEDHDDETSYNILVANLMGFTKSPKSIIQQIAETFPTIPLLVLHSYSQEILIKPLISAGANGYLQAGSSEVKLFEAVKKVADGQELILTETTY